MTDRFSSLRFKVHTVEDQLDKEFPDLFRLPEFKKLKVRPDWDRIVRYICYLYDPGSELIQEFPELQERKEAAATEAGYVRNGNKWPEQLQLIMEQRDADVRKAILAFLKLFRNHEWTDIVVTEEEMDQFQGLRMQAIDEDESDIYGQAKKKNELMEAVAKRRASLKTLYAAFYGDNVDLEAPEFDEMITPENAERILATMEPPFEEVR